MAIREKRSVARSLFSPGSRKFWKGICDQSRLLFIALIVNSDDEGRLEGEPDDIVATVPKMGLDEKATTRLLKELAKNDLISWYDVDGLKYIQINKFEDFQSWSGIMRDPSKYPSHPNAPKLVAESGRSQSVAVVAEYSQNTATTPVREFGSLKTVSNLNSSLTRQDSRSVFAECKKIYRRYVGTSFGSLGNRGYQWDELVKKNGGDLLLSAMEIYARELGKGGRSLNYPFAHFMKNCEEFIEAARNQVEEKQVESQDSDLEAQMQEVLKREQEQEEIEATARRKQKELEASNAGEI